MSKLEKNKRIGGLYIQSVLLDNDSIFYSRVSPVELEKCYKLDGIVNNDKEMIAEVDSTIDFRYIGKINCNKDGKLSSKAHRLKVDADFNNLAKQAEDKIIEAGHKILNNEFPINPKMVNHQDKSCTYCPFKDICYHDEFSYVFYKKEEEQSDEA